MSLATHFVYDSYRVDADGRTLHFDYVVRFSDEPDITLSEQWVLPLGLVPDDPLTERILQALHIGVGVSYYKTFLPPTFVLATPMSPAQASFWNDVYLNGLGEFLYVNQLDPARLARFAASDTTDTAVAAPQLAGYLLGLGGGKDSIVAAELLKTLGGALKTFVFGTGSNLGQTEKVAKDLGLELMAIDRRLDPQIMELNKRPDALNGHVPISVMFALSGLLLCAATASQSCIVANEASASEANTTWKGLAINHQWSKSLQHERLMQAFVHQTISPDLNYFSAIRPLSSIAIAKLFAKHPVYLPDFTSCNLVFRIDPARRPNGRWCGECAKCLSSFIILAPWLPEADILEVFGKDMLNDPALDQLFLELTGVVGHKPLDCVGTAEEMVLSLNLLHSQDKFGSSRQMKIALEKGLIGTGDWDAALQAALKVRSEQAFPPTIAKPLLSAIEKALL